MTIVDDRYPSRVAAEPRIIPRYDPVVHPAKDGDIRQGPLTDDQIGSYLSNGFLAFDGLFSEDEVAAFCAERERIWRRAEESQDEVVVRETDSRVVRSVFAIHETSPLFATLTRDPRLVSMAEQLLGSAVYIMQSRLNYKAGFDGKEFYWHSDFETWHVEDGMRDMRAVSISIALSENTPHNGPLMLVPGSHRHFVACVGATPEEHYRQSLRRQSIGVPDQESLAWLVEQGGIEAPTGLAGSLVMFDCNTMHGSNGNITPRPRSNLFFVYNSVENALENPFGDTHPRPEFLAARRVRPLG